MRLVFFAGLDIRDSLLSSSIFALWIHCKLKLEQNVPLCPNRPEKSTGKTVEKLLILQIGIELITTKLKPTVIRVAKRRCSIKY